MNIRLHASVVAVALATTLGAAQAAVPAQDLEVTGTLKTPTCTVTADGNGEYAYGKIDRSVIPTTGHLVLSTQTQTWTVNCGTGRTYLGYRVIDNQNGSESVVASGNFGLGRVTGYPASKLGYFTVALSNATVDGTARNILRAAPGAAYGSATASSTLDKTLSHSWSSTANTGSVPLAGSVFTVDMAVTGNMANESLRGAPVSEGTPIAGNLTLNYSFGL